MRRFEKEVNEFRQSLSDLALEIAKGSPSDETKPTEGATRKLVFIIDELDRCKPTFALSLLERVKHLFSVDGICFVLVAHLPQLARMVEKEYGVTSGRNYLEKFYQQRVTLPVTRRRHALYVQRLFKKMDVQMDDARILELVRKGLQALAAVYDLSLRTLEQVAGNVALVCLATSERHFRLAPLVSGLCVMRIVNPVLYEKASTGRLRMDEAMKFLRLDEWHMDRVAWHKDVWIYATVTDQELRALEPELDKEVEKEFLYFNMNRLDMIPTTCNHIDDLWQR